MSDIIHPVILSGGSGSRLWPLSRHGRPKQFLSFGTAEPMIIESARRTLGPGFAAPTVVCNADHRFLVAEGFRDAGIGPRRILLEPEGRNTAAAIAVATLSLQADGDDPLILVMPSDHIIVAGELFRAAVEVALPAVRAGRILTFGVKPTRPETGYGYIEQGPPLDGPAAALEIARFHEKPNLETATRYVESGRFSWNAGIFFFRASAVIGAFERHAGDILELTRLALKRARMDLDFVRLDPDSFRKIPAEPFDIAVMERTDRGAVVPVDMGWSDVGSWRSLWEWAPKDSAGNVRVGDALLLDASGSMAWSTDGVLTALVGVDDLIVIASGDAVLVTRKAYAEKVKELVELIKAEGRDDHLSGRTVHRPWGSYTTLEAGPGYRVKRIVVNPGECLSLQYHHHRSEHWVVVQGEAMVTRDSETFVLSSNQSTCIPLRAVHRLENRGTEPLHLIEVQSGNILREDDIVRLDDLYGREEEEKAAPSQK